MSDSNRLVYSTDIGRICPECQRAVHKCSCKQEESIPLGDGIVRVQRESKGRKGKTVTVITGVPLPLQELKELAKSLKAKCGSGGSVQERSIEVQGDHKALLIRELTKLGYQVKAAGG